MKQFSDALAKPFARIVLLVLLELDFNNYTEFSMSKSERVFQAEFWMNFPLLQIRSMCMCLCGHHFQQTDEHQPGMYGCQSYSWSAEQGKRNVPCPCLRLIVWSRELGSVVPSRVSLLTFSTPRLNLVLTYGTPLPLPATVSIRNHVTTDGESTGPVVLKVAR